MWQCKAQIGFVIYNSGPQPFLDHVPGLWEKFFLGSTRLHLRPSWSKLCMCSPVTGLCVSSLHQGSEVSWTCTVQWQGCTCPVCSGASWACTVQQRGCMCPFPAGAGDSRALASSPGLWSQPDADWPPTCPRLEVDPQPHWWPLIVHKKIYNFLVKRLVMFIKDRIELTVWRSFYFENICSIFRPSGIFRDLQQFKSHCNVKSFLKETSNINNVSNECNCRNQNQFFWATKVWGSCNSVLI